MELEKTYIYQVWLQGSFSKAAEALFITQPALSIAIKKVEKERRRPSTIEAWSSSSQIT